MKKIVLFLIAATAIVMAGGDIAPVTPELVPDTPATGGGCTYNPNGTGIDMMFILIMLTAAVYPFKNKLFGRHN